MHTKTLYMLFVLTSITSLFSPRETRSVEEDQQPLFLETLNQSPHSVHPQYPHIVAIKSVWEEQEEAQIYDKSIPQLLHIVSFNGNISEFDWDTHANFIFPEETQGDLGDLADALSPLPQPTSGSNWRNMLAALSCGCIKARDKEKQD
jgi:hypothetical protein